MEKTRDILGLDKDLLTFASDLSFGFSIFDLNLEIDPDFKQVMSTWRLDTVSELSKELGGLRNSYGGLVKDLGKALNEVGDGLQEIRNMGEPIDIGDLEDCMENIVDQLEDNFIDRIEESEYQYEKKIASVLKMAKSIEKKYDYLEYMMGKVRLHAKDEIKDELASKLRSLVLLLTDGDRVGAISGLHDLLAVTLKYKGKEIKRVEADRIRNKADYIIRLMSDAHTERGLEVSSFINYSDVQIGLETGWEKTDHTAPSKDQVTTDLGFDLSPEGTDWAGSFTYQFQNRGYLDPLKDTYDRLTDQVELKWEKEFDSCELAGAMDWQKSLYPNYIDSEIEPAKVKSSIQAINHLIAYIEGQDLPGDMEEALIENLDEEEGALSYLKEDQREEAVDSLEDFIEEVEDQFFEDNLDLVLAEKLIEKAKEILPRRHRWTVEFSAQFQFPWKGGELDLALKRKVRRRPTDSEKDRTIQMGEIDYSHQFGENSIEGSWTKEATAYPRNPVYDKLKNQWEIELEPALKSLDFSFSSQKVHLSYPNASYKDYINTKQKVEVGLGPLDVDWEHYHKAYPSNPSKDWLKRTADIEMEFGSGVSILWETQTKNYPHDSIKNLSSHTLEITMEEEILEGTKLRTSVEYTDKNYPHNPYNDEQIVSFTASLECEF